MNRREGDLFEWVTWRAQVSVSLRTQPPRKPSNHPGERGWQRRRPRRLVRGRQPLAGSRRGFRPVEEDWQGVEDGDDKRPDAADIRTLPRRDRRSAWQRRRTRCRPSSLPPLDRHAVGVEAIASAPSLARPASAPPVCPRPPSSADEHRLIPPRHPPSVGSAQATFRELNVRPPCAPHHARAGVRICSGPVSPALPQRLSRIAAGAAGGRTHVLLASSRHIRARHGTAASVRRHRGTPRNDRAAHDR